MGRIKGLQTKNHLTAVKCACMHPCMATKTISLDLGAYECLCSARLEPRESFSKVVKRAVWPAKAGTAAALLDWRNSSECEVNTQVLDELDRRQESDQPTNNKWK